MDQHSAYLIREATKHDRMAVLQIMRQIWSAIAPKAEDSALPSDNYVFAIIGDCTLFVIEHEDQVVGLNALRVLDLSGREGAAYRKIATIMAFGVDEANRRQGFGAALVDHMWRWLTSEGIEMVHLNVAARNVAARKFYERMGFETLSMQMGRALTKGSVRNYRCVFSSGHRSLRRACCLSFLMRWR